MKNLILGIFVICVFAISGYSQKEPDANNFVSIYPDGTTPSQSLVVFHSNILNATFTVQELTRLKATQEPNATADIVNHSMFRFITDSTPNQVYLGGPISQTFDVPVLVDIVSGNKEIIENSKVRKFNRMQEVFKDQKALFENMQSRTDNLRKLQLQLNSQIQQINDEQETIQKWLKRSLEEEQTDPTQPTPTPEPVEEGDIRTNETTGDLEIYENGTWRVLKSGKPNIQNIQNIQNKK